VFPRRRRHHHRAPLQLHRRVEQTFAAHGDKIAAVIVEPVVGNMGCVPPVPGFLEALRELTARHGALLIFDEVMTGFRVPWAARRSVLKFCPI